MKTKFTNLRGDSEGIHVADNWAWMCGIDDKDVPLCLVLEIINMHDATGEDEFEAYPFIGAVEIMAHMPNKRFAETEKPTRFSLIEDCKSYMGGVPIDHKLLSMDESNKRLMNELKSVDAVIIEEKAQYGTVAAQHGREYVFRYPRFKTADAAYAFYEALIKEYGGVLMTLVGFTLDGPINLMGETGWSVIENQLNGEK